MSGLQVMLLLPHVFSSTMRKDLITSVSFRTEVHMQIFFFLSFISKPMTLGQMIFLGVSNRDIQGQIIYIYIYMHTHTHNPIECHLFADCKKILTSLPPCIWMYLTSIVLWMKGLICSYCWHGIVEITQIAWSTFCFCFIFGKFTKLKLWILY